MIRAIPVHSDMDDVLAWHFDTRGIFSVNHNPSRSPTRCIESMLLRTTRRGVASSVANGRQEDNFWRKLWKLKCSGKIKHFLWRMAHNSLALRVNLRRRGMELDTKCVMCNRLDEDGGHLFLKCKLVKQLWRELNLEDVRH